MISKRKKHIATICLIMGGMVLVGYNFLGSSSQPVVHGQKVERTVQLDSLFMVEVFGPTLEQEADILALFVLKSDICPPCVNNTFDYIDLLNKTEDKKIAATALFIESEPVKVHRFIKITELPISYRIATKELLPVPLKNALQELMFIDSSEQKVFYRVIIPGNVTSELEYKREILDQAFTQW